MHPTSIKLTGHIGFGLCERACVRASVRLSDRQKSCLIRVSKFHIWMPQ